MGGGGGLLAGVYPRPNRACCAVMARETLVRLIPIQGGGSPDMERQRMGAGGASSAEIQGRLQWLTAAAGGFAPGDMARPRRAGKRISGRAPTGECCLLLGVQVGVFWAARSHGRVVCERETGIREANDDKIFRILGGNTAL